MSDEAIIVNGMQERPTTWRDRVRWKLFPYRPCELPELKNPADYSDVIIMRIRTKINWRGRLMLLLTGRLTIESKVVCQFSPGFTVPKGEVNIMPWGWLEAKDR